MSLADRLFRLARAEWSSLKRRFTPVLDDTDPWPSVDAENVDGADPWDRWRPEPAGREDRASRLRRAYANLELPFGAPAAEVKSAYRRLLRAYHPDRQQDPTKKAAATELVRELRIAYELCMRHAGPA
ncbi:MAG: J domain-containing protein [Myxococcota bacterium]